MSPQALTIYTALLSVMLTCSGTWLAKRGRMRHGLFFACVGIFGILSIGARW